MVILIKASKTSLLGIVGGKKNKQTTQQNSAGYKQWK